MNQPMWPTRPFLPHEDDRLLLRDELLVLVDVVPVFEHGVDLAVSHRLEDGDLGDLRDLHRAAKSLLEYVLRDVRVGGRAGPGLLVQGDGSARLGSGAQRAPRHDEAEHRRKRHADEQRDPGSDTM